MQFDFVAPYYDLLSKLVFGAAIEKAKTSLLSTIENGSRVLLIGGGSGYSLAILLNSRDKLKVDYVEPSLGMISLTKKRVGNSYEVNFYQLPIEEFMGDGYDYIITEFFFDMFDKHKIKKIIKIISLKLNREGKWIDTDFREPSTIKDKIILNLMYIFFKITTKIYANELVFTTPLLAQAGFNKLKEYKSKTGFISSRLIVRH